MCVILNIVEKKQFSSTCDRLLPMMMNGQVCVGQVGKNYAVKEEGLGMVAEPKEIYKN